MNANDSAHPDIFEVPGATPNFRTELAAQLAELVPEAVADGKLDIEKLRELLADDVADGNERFGLFWPGKKRALRAAQAPTTATLKPDFAHSKNWDTTQNVFIEGDNLEVLKTLQRHYHNKIKLIYIDPPYNTGKDFVYPDNFKEGLDTYLEWTRQVNEEGKKVSTNSETEGRYHSNWLNMMYPRLKLARNLLTDDGVIFISIDDNEVDNLRKLCNEIFGEGNFIAQFIWKARQFTDARAITNVSTDHEYILAYSRSPQQSLRGIERDESKFSNPDNDPRGPWMSRSILGLATRDQRPNLHYDLIDPTTGRIFPPNPETGWRYSSEKMMQLVVEGRILFPSKNEGRPREKKFRSDMQSEFIAYRSVIDGVYTADGTQESRSMFGAEIFSFPKPTALLKELIKQGSKDSDVVLDFFAGSSTTAHAVMQLNAEDGGKRRFIMVQLPEPTPEESEARKAGFNTIADISRKRIELAGEKIKAELAQQSAQASLTLPHPTPLPAGEGAAVEGELDIGFRAYKLADTNFSKWRVTSEVAVNELEQHLLDLRDSTDDAAQADDLLTELLLKLGYSLTEPIHTETIAGLTVRRVGDNEVLAYLNEHVKPTLEQLRALVEAAPARIIVLEDAFHGDDELKTNLAQFAKSRGIELWTA